LFFGLDGPEVHAIGVTLIAAVGLILVIGCINVLNLIAARNTVREPELAIRLALGAGKGRLMRQLCTETLLLGLLGGGAGFLGSLWVCDALHVWALALMHDVTGGAWNLFVDLSPDPQVFTFAVVLSVAAGLGVGLRPALRAAGTNIESALKRRAAGLTVGGRPHRNLLLGVQVAGSLVLLAGAALLLRGAVRAGDVDPGFDSKHLALVVAWSQTDIGQVLPNRRDRAQRIEERLRALPEVASIGAADRVPLLGHSITPFRTDEDRWVNGCVMTHVDADYFPTLGLRVLAGRTFTPEEVSTRAPVAVITQSAARHLWPNGDALQRHFAIGKSDDMYTVIGVIADARLTLLSRVDDVDAFFPQAGTAAWLVRTRGKPAAAFPSLYATMRAIDPAMPVEVQAMEEGPMRLQRMMARIPATIALFLAGLSLALAAVGISGAVAFAVAQRTREIGVRMALGATSASVIRHILRQTLRSAVWGAVFGTLGAIATAVLLTRLVLNPEFPDVTYGASTFPWFSLAAALGVLLVVLLAAAILPARRASKVDPLVALRGD
jgi:predicted permease